MLSFGATAEVRSECEGGRREGMGMDGRREKREGIGETGDD